MPQSLVEIYVHIVFSTKGRAPFLKDREFRERTHAYLKGICENQGSPSLAIGGVEDHVHILCRLSKTGDVSTVVRELKATRQSGLKRTRSVLPTSIGSKVTGHFRSARRISRRSSNTLRIRWRITVPR